MSSYNYSAMPKIVVSYSIVSKKAMDRTKTDTLPLTVK
jgi:hypothetical protein